MEQGLVKVFLIWLPADKDGFFRVSAQNAEGVTLFNKLYEWGPDSDPGAMSIQVMAKLLAQLRQTHVVHFGF